MTDSPGVLFDALLEIMARLRGPHGCPWDREQTPTSLKPFLVEEAYEVIEAIESGSPSDVREELGDLLFQVIFHARLATEAGEFTMGEVLDHLAQKMIRRHPHVFADAAVETPRQALSQWEAIKQAEGDAAGRRRSAIDGVPRSLPSLLRAQRLQVKAARLGFDWPDAGAAWEKVREEFRETQEALRGGDRVRVKEELGDVLFSLVNVARLSDIDAEDALQAAIEKFRRRFTAIESELTTRGTDAGAVGPDELDRLWEAVKAREQTTPERPR
jgi:tetrapyrrole methylase family protein/MazG family protein